MACLAISLQPVNGPDILLQTRFWFPVSRALAAVSAFRLARLHLARGNQQPAAASSSSPSPTSLDAIGDDPLAAGSGQLVVGVESQYRVVYRLVNSIYVLGVTTSSDHASPAVHAFAVADAVNQAVSVVVAACRGIDVTPEKVHRKYPEVYLALDLVLHGVGSVRLSQILATIHGDNLARMVNSSPDAEARARGADPWPAVEHLAHDRHAARDAFTGASFELPQETLAAGDEFSASNIAPAAAATTGDEAPPEEAAPTEKDPFAASELVNKPEEALVGGFKKNKETALVVADPAAALAGLEVTTLPPAEATKPTFIGVEGFEGDYGGIEFSNEEASLADAFEGFNAPFGGGLDASEFVTTTKKDHKDKSISGLELLAMSGGQAPNAATPLENLLVTKSTEMTAPELSIVEEINAEFKESILVRVGLKGTIFLRTLPPKKVAGKETEFSFRLEGTSGMKRAALQSTVLSNLENGLFHVRTPSKEEPIPIMKYSFLPKHSPLPLRMRLVKRHSGTLLSVMIQYASNPMLPQPLSNVTFIVKLPVDPTLLNISPKAVLNRAERELKWHIPDIPLKGPAGRLRARMPVDQDSKDGELEVVGMVKFTYQGPFTLSGIKLCPATDGIALFNERAARTGRGHERDREGGGPPATATATAPPLPGRPRRRPYPDFSCAALPLPGLLDFRGSNPARRPSPGPRRRQVGSSPSSSTDPDSVVSSAAARRVRPDTMSCGSDGCRDDGSEEFRRPRPSKVAADDLVEPARCSDAATPASWIGKKLLVDPTMLFIGCKIGEGAHGKVYKGKYGDQIVAIKVLNNGSTPEEKATLEARFIREVNMMCRVKHDNLVKFIGACKEPLMVIVSELLPGMSLKNYLNSIRPSQLEIHTAIGYALDIAHAMECLHANGIIHRDLKPDNLLLTANRKKLKLTDFGLAREETVTEMMTAETGTYRWMAPELYSTVTLQRGEKKHYTNKVDVYSFGIVLWELLTNKMPFEGMSNLQAAYAAAFKQVRPPLPEETPQELVFIVQSCWVEDPAMRPSFSQIIRMLDAFLMTIPPPPPSESDEDVESEETMSSLSSKSSSVSSIVSRATSKLSVVRHLFASKKAGNGRT